MRRVLASIALVVAITTSLGAQALTPSLYITPSEDGFEVYLAAAIVKKGVPVSVLDHEEGATYILKAIPDQGATQQHNGVFQPHEIVRAEWRRRRLLAGHRGMVSEGRGHAA